MQKYNYELDLESENSNAKIINQVANGKDVLEFGPAFGRMTKYLHVHKKCNVDIVEIDQESGDAASKYARIACVGDIYGDIEKYEWKNKIVGYQYDYIIFTDVLEHLHHPEKVLYECKQFLKKDGCILCSVPNIAHSSVIISLWNNDFTYNDVGLLDNTHIHFFTKNTFVNMAQKCGFCVEKIEEISSDVGTNEIRWTYENVPACVESELKFREDGEAYQYIFKLVTHKEDSVLINKCKGARGYQCICYVRQKQDVSFSKEKCIVKNYNAKYVDVYFDIKDYEYAEGVCIELFPKNSLIKIIQVEVDGIESSIMTNGSKVKDNIYLFLKEAQIFVNVPQQCNGYVHVVYEILLTDNSNMCVFSELVELKHNIESDCRMAQECIEKLQQKEYTLESELNEKKSQMHVLEIRYSESIEEKERISEEKERISEEKERISEENQRLNIELHDLSMRYEDSIRKQKVLEQDIYEKNAQCEELCKENEELKQKFWTKIKRKLK